MVAELFPWYQQLLQKCRELGFTNIDPLLFGLVQCILSVYTPFNSGTGGRGLLVQLDYEAMRAIHQLSFVIEIICSSLCNLPTAILSASETFRLADLPSTLLIKVRDIAPTRNESSSFPLQPVQEQHSTNRSSFFEDESLPPHIEHPLESSFTAAASPHEHRAMSAQLQPNASNRARVSKTQSIVSKLNISHKRPANICVIEMLDSSRLDVVRELIEIMSQKQITDGSHVYPLPTPFVFVILTTSEHVPLIQAATYGRLFYSLSIYGTAVPNVESSFIWRSPADFLPDYSRLAEKVRNIYISPLVRKFIQDVIVRLRSCSYTQIGVPPRTKLDLILACQIAAGLLFGKDFVYPDYLSIVAQNILSFRLEGNVNVETERLINELILRIEKPE